MGQFAFDSMKAKDAFEGSLISRLHFVQPTASPQGGSLTLEADHSLPLGEGGPKRLGVLVDEGPVKHS